MKLRLKKIQPENPVIAELQKSVKVLGANIVGESMAVTIEEKSLNEAALDTIKLKLKSLGWEIKEVKTE